MVFQRSLTRSYLTMMNQKIGLIHSDDSTLVDELLELMQQQQLDYTLTFDLLTRSLVCDKALAEAEGQLGDWIAKWRPLVDLSCAQTSMRKMNPVIIPRNHIVETSHCRLRAKWKARQCSCILNGVKTTLLRY